jgi:peroxiredoxin
VTFTGAFPGRVTYVVDKDGRVKYMFDDLVNAAMHPVKALAGLAIK